MTKTIAILYGTTDGHTRKIANYIASKLQALNYRCEVIDVKQLPDSFSVNEYDGVMIGASVHAGKYQQEAVKTIRRFKESLNAMPTAFFSVSLGIASSDPEAQHDAQHYIDALRAQTQWHPSITESFAGALLYTQYGFFKRLLMKSISKRSGGDTDTSRDHEYTNWKAVDRFVEDFARLIEGRSEVEHHPAP